MNLRLFSYKWEDFRGTDSALITRLGKITKHPRFPDRDRETYLTIREMYLAAIGRRMAWQDYWRKLEARSLEGITNYMLDVAGQKDD